MRKAFIWLALAVLALGACSAAGGRVAVQDAWARPSVAGSNAAVYLSITNGGSSEDVLLGASGEQARAVELHQSMMVEEDVTDMSGEDEGGMEHEHMAMGDDAMQMTPIDSLSLAAGESVTFEPGGYHVMLIDLQQNLELGETFEITLHFEQAGDVSVQVEVADR